MGAHLGVHIAINRAIFPRALSDVSVAHWQNLSCPASETAGEQQTFRGISQLGFLLTGHEVAQPEIGQISGRQKENSVPSDMT